MAKPTQQCFIFIQLPESPNWIPCASLSVQELAADSFVGTFLYGKKYLQRPNTRALDPFHLPLTEKPQRFTTFQGLPGAVRDTSPDYWGRRILQAKLNKPAAEISELDYLLLSPNDSVGNLSFSTSLQRPPASKPYNRTHHLHELCATAEILQQTGKLPHETLENLDPGTSLGGARPKATIIDNNTLYLAKLPEKADTHDQQLIEFATLKLAQLAGITTCEPRLVNLGASHALLLSRFDRQWNPTLQYHQRLGFASSLTVLNASDSPYDRSRWSYPLLAQELNRWTSNPPHEKLQLFKRMVFNAMVTNNDDHPRNHALLHSTSGWTLSPAYDIVPTPAIAQDRRDLALDIGLFGRTASIYNLTSCSHHFGLTIDQATTIISKMLPIVQNWASIFTQLNIPHRTIEHISSAFLPPCFFFDNPPR